MKPLAAGAGKPRPEAPGRAVAELRGRLAQLAGPLLVLGAAGAMLVWCWRRWPDPLIDFGREIYVPWRLTQGEVLYRDIAHFNGPLSPYLNALWFRLFGVSLDVLVFCNLALLAALTLLLYRAIASIADRVAATAAGLVFVSVFAFGQLLRHGNFNYVAPYSHELTHGLLLGLLAIVAFERCRPGRPGPWAVSGLLLGLTFLTKPEPFVATLGAVSVGLGVRLWSEPTARQSGLRDAGVLAGAALVPPAIACLLLAQAMPVAAASRGVLGAWTYAFDPALATLPYYRRVLGTLELSSNLASLGRWSAGYAIVFGTAVVCALALRSRRAIRIATALVAIVCAVAAAVAFQRLAPWQEAARPLPALLALLLVASLAAQLRNPRVGEDPPRALRCSVLLTFSWLLLAKIALNASFAHYGFALAMPGTLLLVAALVGWLPRRIERLRPGAGALVRVASLGTVAVAVAGLLGVTRHFVSAKTVPVSRGADLLLAGGPGRARAVNRLLHEIDARVGARETLAVLPEGVMLNYLTRRVNPTGYLNFMPPELLMFGESAMLEAFREHPPDFIVLAHRPTREYGLPFFGIDYGQTLHRWIAGAYHPIAQIGETPLREDRGFGLQLLERDDRSGGRPADR